MQTFIKIPEFTSGERVSIFLQIRDMARERGLASVAELAERGQAHDRQTGVLDRRWAGRSRGRRYTQAVMDLSRRVQPVLVGIRDMARAYVRALPESDPLPARVEEMLRDIYPGGVGALVSQSFVDRVAGVDLVLGKLQTTHADLVRELGMSRQVAHLATLAAAYRDAVDNGNTLRFAKVEGMREQGQALLRALIALILGTFYDERDPQQVTARTELLKPVEHMRRMTQPRRRSRRRPGPGPDDTTPAPSTPAPDTDADADAAPAAPAPAPDTEADADAAAIARDVAAREHASAHARLDDAVDT